MKTLLLIIQRTGVMVTCTIHHLKMGIKKKITSKIRGHKYTDNVIFNIFIIPSWKLSAEPLYILYPLIVYKRYPIEVWQSQVAQEAGVLRDQLKFNNKKWSQRSGQVVKSQIILDQKQNIKSRSSAGHEFQGFVCRYLYLIYCTTPPHILNRHGWTDKLHAWRR